MTRYAYKLLRERQNGTLGPLFINRKLVIPVGEWLKAEDHPTKGYAHRPGWHCSQTPYAPHLSVKGRIWYCVQIADYYEHKRPENQGGLWFIAKHMIVIEPVLGV